MVTSLFEHGRVRTTVAKAKELRRWADRVVTLAKRGDVHARRQALAIVRDKAVVHKLFEDAPRRFGDRAGGYTNVAKIGRRPGDAAPISLVELVSAGEEQKEKKKKPKASKRAAGKAKKEAALEPKEKEEPKEGETGPKEKKKKPEASKRAAGKAKKEAALKPKEKEKSKEGETGPKAADPT
jgi:large subunit ribosomal protein L17